MDPYCRRLHSRDVLCGCSNVAKVWVCERSQLGLGNDTSTQVQHWVGSFDISNVHGLFHTLGIPVSGGLALGFLAGFVRTR